jgi:xanthosine utilization system XapX-like protein
MAEHIDTKGTLGPVTHGAGLGEGVAGAIAVLIVFVAVQFGLEIPEPVAAAIAVIIGYIGTLIGGKLVSPERTIQHQRDRGNL